MAGINFGDCTLFDTVYFGYFSLTNIAICAKSPNLADLCGGEFCAMMILTLLKILSSALEFVFGIFKIVAHAKMGRIDALRVIATVENELASWINTSCKKIGNPMSIKDLIEPCESSIPINGNWTKPIPTFFFRGLISISPKQLCVQLVESR